MTSVRAVLQASAPDAVALATRELDAGRLVVYPTDTLYGLGADALDEDAVLGVFETKGRGVEKALPVCVGEFEESRHVARITPLARRLAARFLPGALTLVMPAAPSVPDAVTGGGDTVAVRVPANDFARALASHFGPLTATSANLSGRPAPRTVAEAEAQLAGAVALFVDGGALPGVPSTLVDATGDIARVIREGAVPARVVEDA